MKIYTTLSLGCRKGNVLPAFRVLLIYRVRNSYIRDYIAGLMLVVQAITLPAVSLKTAVPLNTDEIFV